MPKTYLCAALALLLLAVVDAAWAAQVGIDLPRFWMGLSVPALAGALAALLFAIPRESTRRAGHLAASVAILVGFSKIGGTLSYLVLTLHVPVADPLLLAIDRAMGFDWLAWSDFVAARPTLRMLLFSAYTSLLPSIVVTLLWLSGSGRFSRCSELTGMILCGGFASIAISAFLPAMSAPIWLGFVERAHVAGQMYPDYVSDLLALHNGNLREIPNTSGIVSFPSFHVALVILLCYSLRRTALFWPATAFAILTTISVPSVGMHYLIDIPGGTAVAAGTIIIAHRMLGYGDIHPSTNNRRLRGGGAAVTSNSAARSGTRRRLFTDEPGHLYDL